MNMMEAATSEPSLDLDSLKLLEVNMMFEVLKLIFMLHVIYGLSDFLTIFHQMHIIPSVSRSLNIPSLMGTIII